MKFQNCILINFATDGRKDGQVESNMPFNFSKVGGIKSNAESALIKSYMVRRST